VHEPLRIERGPERRRDGERVHLAIAADLLERPSEGLVDFGQGPATRVEEGRHRPQCEVGGSAINRSWRSPGVT
jgi:hypothetical protein